MSQQKFAERVRQLVEEAEEGRLEALAIIKVLRTSRTLCRSPIIRLLLERGSGLYGPPFPLRLR